MEIKCYVVIPFFSFSNCEFLQIKPNIPPSDPKIEDTYLFSHFASHFHLSFMPEVRATFSFFDQRVARSLVF